MNHVRPWSSKGSLGYEPKMISYFNSLQDAGGNLKAL
jgi:hypothetical protein